MEERSGIGVSVADRAGKDFQGLRHQLLRRVRSPTHALTRPAPVETEDWGFARIPSLEQLFRRAAAAEQQQQAATLLRRQQHERQAAFSSQPGPDSALQAEPAEDGCKVQDDGEEGLLQRETSLSMPAESRPVLHTEFSEALRSSSAFRSPHCDAALANAFHVQGQYIGLAGSVRLPFVPEAEAEHVRGAIKQHINAAWSSEAVRCGVGCAKAGNHDEAIRYYNRALELNAQNVDAFVARGAAKANQQLLGEAAEDFRLALNLDPDSRNAACYLEAVQKRLAEVAQDEEQQQRASPSPRTMAELSEGEVQPGAHGRRDGQACAAEGREVRVEAGGRGEGRPPPSDFNGGQQDCADGVDLESNRPPAAGSTSGNESTDDDSVSSDGVNLRDKDIRRALEILSKARSAEKQGRSKHKRHKSKSKKSKTKHRSSSSKKKKRRRSSP